MDQSERHSPQRSLAMLALASSMFGSDVPTNLPCSTCSQYVARRTSRKTSRTILSCCVSSSWEASSLLMFDNCAPNLKTLTFTCDINILFFASSKRRQTASTSGLTHWRPTRCDRLEETRRSFARRCLSENCLSNSPSKTCARTWPVSFSTASRTPPTPQERGSRPPAMTRSTSLATWASARMATLRTSAFRPSTVCVMPRTLQSSGAVVALTTKVSAATLPTMKSTSLPSRWLSAPPARSSSTRMARARPTKPRSPPQVITAMSRTPTRSSPARLSIGQSTRSVAKRTRVSIA
mmetsp:Transcript_68281/g.191309  ORF Transcript_68281/g.191309 Transcript_68281/m.191309 type:complete len:294 (-) Transcript_68281:1187-2068(-)